MQDIKISQVLDDLNRGLTRSPDTPGYDPEVGSIKEKYNLTNKELKYLFASPKLKNRRTGQTVMINIIDDTEETPEVLSESTEVPNNSGLTSEHFINEWDKEVEQAQNIRKMAQEALGNTQS